jgi:sulfite exporter TauE/SafE
MGTIWLAFITGLTTGGFSCFAVQGGLLTSALAEGDRKRGLLAFLIAKIIAYTLLGFLLGFLGASLNISPKAQGWLQIFIGLYMLVTAARLLNIHPIFRYFVIQPPKVVLRLLKNQSQAKSVFTPIVLGALTILIPCGITQAMMILALGSGNPLWGAGIMAAFTLGTSPVFFAIGLAASEALKHKAFAVIAAGFIFVIGILSLNSGQILRGSAHTLQNYWQALVGTVVEMELATIKSGVQDVSIEVSNNGYESNVNTLKVGVPVRLRLTSKNVKSCARAFALPDLNYFKVLPETGTETIEFTPKKLGQLTYTCSMGMYTGSFNVVE